MLRRIATILVVAALIAAPAFAILLEGKTFKGEMTKEGDKKPEPDTFIFSGGTFRSTGCDTYGFKAAPYAVEKIENAMRFTSVATSEKEGTMTWKGVVRGKTVEGTAVWEKDGQEPVNFTFKGTQTP